jgi:predicted ferric reductase
MAGPAAPGSLCRVSLLLRGIFWFGLYVALTLLPLAVALWERPWEAPRPVLVEISVAVGLLALPLMVFQFALVTRLAASSRPFGSDALIQFHARMGVVALAAVLVHPLLLAGHGVGIAAWNPFGGPWLLQSGAIALWAAVAISVTSIFRRPLRLGYEAWQLLHLVFAIVLVAAMAAHILAVRGYSGQPLMHGLVLAYSGLAVLLLLRYRVVRPLLLWRRPWTLVENRDVGGSTRLLRLRPVGHAGFAFEPGQFAWLATGTSPLWSEQHPISMASAAEGEGDTLEFGIKALGDWSGQVVPALQPGARLWVDGPFGAFTPERKPAQGYVLIAGGIGISPMRSILKTLREREDARPVLLFYAAWDRSRMAFIDELEALQAQLNFVIIPVLESPPTGWPGERGYVTAEVLRRHLPRQYRRFQFFVCGPVPMMDALEKILVELGVPAAAVQTERFDMV